MARTSDTATVPPSSTLATPSLPLRQSTLKSYDNIPGSKSDSDDGYIILCTNTVVV